MITIRNESGLVKIFDNNNQMYALIINNGFNSESIIFPTPDEFSQQLGYLPHKAGSHIQRHRHILNKRDIFYTQEVLFIREGSVRVNFYDNENRPDGSVILFRNDVILLCQGGHGFDILEDTVMIEVKQGPYTGINDKERF